MRFDKNRIILMKDIEGSLKFYLKFEKKNVENLKGDIDLNIIRPYIFLLNDYAKDLLVLVKAHRNVSIMPMARNFVECYTDLKILMLAYMDKTETTFDYEVGALFASTLEQLRKEFDALKKDPSIEDDKKDEILSNRLEHMEAAIENNFKEFKSDINRDNFQLWEESIMDINRELKRRFKLPILKADKVSYAFKNNNVLAEDSNFSMEGALSLYSTMCSCSHNNIHTVFHRVTNTSNAGAMIVPNKENPSINGILFLVSICLRDIQGDMINIVEMVS